MLPKKRVIKHEFFLNWIILTVCLLNGLVVWRSSFNQLRLERLTLKQPSIDKLNYYLEFNFNQPLFDSPELTLEPNLAGTSIVTGKKLYYILDKPPVYGNTYQVQVHFGSQAIQGQFHTRDRLFALIDTEAETEGRLAIYNQTQQQKTILTPPDLVVTDFKVYPQGDKILFAAYDRNDPVASNRQQLYTVTTGVRSSETVSPAGRVNLVVDAKDYQNLSFDLAQKGKTVVVQRVHRANSAEVGLWVMNEEETKPIGIPTRDFQVAPDGNSIAVVQTKGVAIIPLTEGGSAQLYQNYEKIIGFSPDGNQKLLVRSHSDGTRSLMLVDDNGEKELFQTIAPTIDCEFDPSREYVIFCLKTNIITDGEALRPEPYISMIDLKTGADTPIIILPNNQGVTMSMSPDGTALLFDQLIPSYRLNDPRINGRVWQLPVENVSGDTIGAVLPEELIPGYQPQWIP